MGKRVMVRETETALHVRELRKYLGLTQRQFADKLGVTFATVNRWENGRAVPSPLALKQLEDLQKRTDNLYQPLPEHKKDPTYAK